MFRRDRGAAVLRFRGAWVFGCARPRKLLALEGGSRGETLREGPIQSRGEYKRWRGSVI